MSSNYTSWCPYCPIFSLLIFNQSLILSTFIKPFHATSLFLDLLKTSENLWCSNVFMGIKKMNGMKLASNAEFDPFFRKV